MSLRISLVHASDVLPKGTATNSMLHFPGQSFHRHKSASLSAGDIMTGSHNASQSCSGGSPVAESRMFCSVISRLLCSFRIGCGMGSNPQTYYLGREGTCSKRVTGIMALLTSMRLEVLSSSGAALGTLWCQILSVTSAEGR